MAQTIANKQSPDIYRDPKKKKKKKTDNWSMWDSTNEMISSMVQAELVRNKFTGLIV